MGVLLPRGGRPAADHAVVLLAILPISTDLLGERDERLFREQADAGKRNDHRDGPAGIGAGEIERAADVVLPPTGRRRRPRTITR